MSCCHVVFQVPRSSLGALRRKGTGIRESGRGAASTVQGPESANQICGMSENLLTVDDRAIQISGHKLDEKHTVYTLLKIIGRSA